MNGFHNGTFAALAARNSIRFAVASALFDASVAAFPGGQRMAKPARDVAVDVWKFVKNGCTLW